MYEEKKGYLSLEERMGCGIGACFTSFKQKRQEKDYIKICSDGPVFEKEYYEIMNGLISNSLVYN